MQLITGEKAAGRRCCACHAKDRAHKQGGTAQSECAEKAQEAGAHTHTMGKMRKINRPKNEADLYGPGLERNSPGYEPCSARHAYHSKMCKCGGCDRWQLHFRRRWLHVPCRLAFCCWPKLVHARPLACCFPETSVTWFALSPRQLYALVAPTLCRWGASALATPECSRLAPFGAWHVLLAQKTGRSRIQNIKIFTIPKRPQRRGVTLRRPRTHTHTRKRRGKQTD